MANSRRTNVIASSAFFVVLGVPAAFGAVRFWSDGKAGRTPPIWAWILTGLAVCLAATLLSMVIARVFRLDEKPANALTAVIVSVMLIAGLPIAFFWVRAQEGPIATVLGPACRGEAVASAASTGTKGPVKVAVLDALDHRTGWTFEAAGWRADNPSEAALVACLSATQREHIETCNYRTVAGQLATIDRFAEVIQVRLVVAKTGKLLTQFTLRTEPRACAQTEKEGETDFVGRVEFSHLSAKLAPYAAGATARTSTG